MVSEHWVVLRRTWRRGSTRQRTFGGARAAWLARHLDDKGDDHFVAPDRWSGQLLGEYSLLPNACNQGSDDSEEGDDRMRPDDCMKDSSNSGHATPLGCPCGDVPRRPGDGDPGELDLVLGGPPASLLHQAGRSGGVSVAVAGHPAGGGQGPAQLLQGSRPLSPNAGAPECGLHCRSQGDPFAKALVGRRSRYLCVVASRRRGRVASAASPPTAAFAPKIGLRRTRAGLH